MKRNILIDLSVVADALLFSKLIKTLRERGHRVLVTFRGIRELNHVQKGLKLRGVLIGGYGQDLASKLTMSSKRIVEMANLVHTYFRGELDAVVSNTGVEACRVGFGLTAKVHTFWDHPQATPQAKLTLPLSDYVYYPWIIDKLPKYKGELEKYGVTEERRVPYEGFLHLAWIRDFKVNEHIIEEMGFDPDRSVIMFRHSETGAAYLFGRKDITLTAVKELAKRHPEYQFITKLRYRSDDSESLFKGIPNIRVYSEFIDLQSLIAKADLVIGGGATINLEASFFGTPVIACRQIESPIDDFLIGAGFAVKANTVKELIDTFEGMNTGVSGEGDGLRLRAKNTYMYMEFPLEKLIHNLEKG